MVNNGKEVKCFNGKLKSFDGNKYTEVHFVKQRKEELKAEGIAHQILVSSMRGNALQSFFHYVDAVYSPILVEDKESTISAQLKSLIDNLKSGLQSTLRRGAKKGNQSEDDLRGILGPSDEIEFWVDMENSNVSSHENERLRQKAEIINKHFTNISKGFYDLNTMELAAVRDFTDTIFDTLDTVW